MEDIKKDEILGFTTSGLCLDKCGKETDVSKEDEENENIDLKSNEFIKEILDAYIEENLIKSYSITNKIVVNVCEGIEPSDLEEMLIGALYIAYEDDSYYIDIEVVK